MKKRFTIDEEAYLNENINNSFKPERHGHKVKIEEILSFHSRHDYKVYDYDKKDHIKVKEDELDPIPEKQYKINNNIDERKFEKISNEIGKFTDLKNKQYGSSVDATYKMMKVLMERYTYDEDNYLMPKALLKDMLLQVRMMDKQNRIFNNPSGKGDSESPYRDLAGYSLIGIDMVERNK